MGNNIATCSDCGEVRPERNSDVQIDCYDRLVDQVIASYYPGWDFYYTDSRWYCAHCFWRPRRFEERRRQREREEEEKRRKAREEQQRIQREREKQQRLQKEREERQAKEREQQRQLEKEKLEREQRRRERIEREAQRKRKEAQRLQRQREEQERARERKRREELIRREQEAKREQERLRVLEEERKKREEELKKREQVLLEEDLNTRTSLANKYTFWAHKRKEKQKQSVLVQRQRPLSLTQGYIYSSDSESDTSEDAGNMYSENDKAMITENLMTMVSRMSPTNVLTEDMEWFENVQMYILCHYARLISVGHVELDILAEILFSIQQSEGYHSSDSLLLTQSLCSLCASHSVGCKWIPASFYSDIAGKFLSGLLQIGCEHSPYAFRSTVIQHCFNKLISLTIENHQLRDALQSIAWSPKDALLFLQNAKECNLPVDDQVHILHLVQAYRVPLHEVEDAMPVQVKPHQSIRSHMTACTPELVGVWHSTNAKKHAFVSTEKSKASTKTSLPAGKVNPSLRISHTDGLDLVGDLHHGSSLKEPQVIVKAIDTAPLSSNKTMLSDTELLGKQDNSSTMITQGAVEQNPQTSQSAIGRIDPIGKPHESPLTSSAKASNSVPNNPSARYESLVGEQMKSSRSAFSAKDDCHVTSQPPSVSTLSKSSLTAASEKAALKSDSSSSEICCSLPSTAKNSAKLSLLHKSHHSPNSMTTTSDTKLISQKPQVRAQLVTDTNSIALIRTSPNLQTTSKSSPGTAINKAEGDSTSPQAKSLVPMRRHKDAQKSDSSSRELQKKSSATNDFQITTQPATNSPTSSMSHKESPVKCTNGYASVHSQVYSTALQKTGNSTSVPEALTSSTRTPSQQASPGKASVDTVSQTSVPVKALVPQIPQVRAKLVTDTSSIALIRTSPNLQTTSKSSPGTAINKTEGDSKSPQAKPFVPMRRHKDAQKTDSSSRELQKKSSATNDFQITTQPATNSPMPSISHKESPVKPSNDYESGHSQVYSTALQKTGNSTSVPEALTSSTRTPSQQASLGKASVDTVSQTSVPVKALVPQIPQVRAKLVTDTSSIALIRTSPNLQTTSKSSPGTAINKTEGDSKSPQAKPFVPMRRHKDAQKTDSSSRELQKKSSATNDFQITTQPATNSPMPSISHKESPVKPSNDYESGHSQVYSTALQKTGNSTSVPKALTSSTRTPSQQASLGKVSVDTVSQTSVPVKALGESDLGSHILSRLDAYIKKEPQKDLATTLDKIRSTRTLDEATLAVVEDILTQTIEMVLPIEAKKFHIDLDYEKYLTVKMLSQAKFAFKHKGQLNTKEIASALATLACAVRKCKGYVPHIIQLVAVAILLLSDKNKVSRLLEVLTGEGKSCIIAMFAAVIAIQGRSVDIITSSPILAERDAMEWDAFYSIFSLKATNNTNIDSSSGQSVDKERQKRYQHHIVYGTLSSFAADILREEFEKKEVRGHRKFDAVIADEVDLLMLDEGVQFTYLSHQASVLRHIEPVLASVWAVVGQYKIARTMEGVLCVGTPKFFTDALNDCGMNDSLQLLNRAKQLGILSEYEVKTLYTEKDQELVRQISEKITTDAMVSLLNELITSPPCIFVIYTLSSDGLLIPMNRGDTTGNESLQKVEVLVLSNGIACEVHTQDDLKSGACAKVSSLLQFNDEQVDEDTLKLPKFLKEFVMDQLPTYIDSALKSLWMTENREYLIKNGEILPIDFQNSGAVESNKRWGGGLQQMLELKHNLKLSPLSVVTNFMSHIEVFSRYAEHGAIYGLSGTLAIDSPVTADVLLKLYKVHVCSIPTHKRQKVYEKRAIIIEGGDDIWLSEISCVINEAIEPTASWRKGRAVLVLCEDIKTAHDMKTYIELACSKGKVTLYTRSDSTEINSIKRTFCPGDILVATNLAGRGTDIKVDEAVNLSGGLFCVITFLPRNRRVELQAFGRTGRCGQPGSVQYVLKLSTLPPHYQGHNIDTIRKLRDEEEQIRLDHMMETDVKEVKLREKLFKQHCDFLSTVYREIGDREDKSVAIESLNECWGQWLQTRINQIEALEEDKLVHELAEVQKKWRPIVPVSPTEFLHLPCTNFYHLIKFGNKLCVEEEAENAAKACPYYSKAIAIEPEYAAIALYNRAYCTITMRKDGLTYIDKAIKDILEAQKAMSRYGSEVLSVLQSVAMSQQLSQARQNEIISDPSQHQPPQSEENLTVTSQMNIRFQLYSNIHSKMDEAVKELEKFRKSGDDVIAVPVGVFSLIPCGDYWTSQELFGLWNLGLEVVFSVEKMPKFCWEGLIVCLLGVAQIIGGVLVTAFTAGAATSFGLNLIAEGISDCYEGVKGMMTGDFDWKEWGVAKATSIAVTLASGGIARFVDKGYEASKVSLKQFVRDLKNIPKVAQQSWGTAAKANLKQASKLVTKEVVKQTVWTTSSLLQRKALEAIVKKIGEGLKQQIMGRLLELFVHGELSGVVDSKFVEKLPPSYISNDKMSPSIESNAHAFFNRVVADVVDTLTSDSKVAKELTSVSRNLFGQLSGKPQLRGHRGLITAIETGICIAEVTGAIRNLQCLVDHFIPLMLENCRVFCKSGGFPSTNKAKYSKLKSANKLKQDLAHSASQAYGEAIASLLLQDLSSVVAHTWSRTVNHVGGKFLSKYVLHSESTRDKIEAGQIQNFIRSNPPTDLKNATSSMGSDAHKAVTHYVNEISKSGTPGSLLDLKVAVEHYNQGVTLYKQADGKFQRMCAIEPSSSSFRYSKRKPNIELLYTPPSRDHEVGHYDIIVQGKKIPVISEASNCLFHAYAAGKHAHTDGQHARRLTTAQQNRDALEVRRTVAKSLQQNPQLWQRYVSKRQRLDHIRGGSIFAYIGAGGPRNGRTKVIPDTYEERVHGSIRYTEYKQQNNVHCKAKRVYSEAIRLGTASVGHRGQMIENQHLKMKSMKVHMTGLNFEKNEGRCWDTKPVTGMLKLHEGVQSESTVSYHLCPSEAGANAGNAYANAVMTSAHYNKMERAIWSQDVKKWIGKNDFSMKVEVQFGPLVPSDMHTFVRNLNQQRREQGRDVMHPSNTKSLQSDLKLIFQKDPRAQRVENMDIELTNHLGQVRNIRMPADNELYVPPQYCTRDQPPVYANEINKGTRKIEVERINQPPSYRRVRKTIRK